MLKKVVTNELIVFSDGYVYMENNSLIVNTQKGKCEMSVWHGSLRKRKLTGGRKRAYRVKRNYEKGAFPAETTLGESRMRCVRGHGGNIKVKALSAKHASVTDPKSGKTEKTEILRVIKNAANVDYNRRGVITKGAEIETSLGLARVTSRPGNAGVINAVLLSSKEEKS